MENSRFERAVPGKLAGSSAPRRTPILVCSVCERQFSSSESTALPFCSERCQKIDLGRWFNESYGLPIERPEDPDSVDLSPDSD